MPQDSVKLSFAIRYGLPASEAVRARLRVLVKRVLRKHDYPPDRQDSATRTVLEQAEVLCVGWAA